MPAALFNSVFCIHRQLQKIIIYAVYIVHKYYAVAIPVNNKALIVLRLRTHIKLLTPIQKELAAFCICDVIYKCSDFIFVHGINLKHTAITYRHSTIAAHKGYLVFYTPKQPVKFTVASSACRRKVYSTLIKYVNHLKYAIVKRTLTFR